MMPRPTGKISEILLMTKTTRLAIMTLVNLEGVAITSYRVSDHAVHLDVS